MNDLHKVIRNKLTVQIYRMRPRIMFASVSEIGLDLP